MRWGAEKIDELMAARRSSRSVEISPYSAATETPMATSTRHSAATRILRTGMRDRRRFRFAGGAFLPAFRCTAATSVSARALDTSRAGDITSKNEVTDQCRPLQTLAARPSRDLATRALSHRMDGSAEVTGTTPGPRFLSDLLDGDSPAKYHRKCWTGSLVTLVRFAGLIEKLGGQGPSLCRRIGGSCR